MFIHEFEPPIHKLFFLLNVSYSLARKRVPTNVHNT